MVTPLRDGMNLVAKEYLATRVENDGVLILSELAGASKELHQALIVNPFDINELADSIYEAIKLSKQDQIEKNIDLIGLYSYNSIIVSEIKKKMNDDIRILFTEYRQKRKGNFNSNIRRISNLDGNDK